MGASTVSASEKCFPYGMIRRERARNQPPFIAARLDTRKSLVFNSMRGGRFPFSKNRRPENTTKMYLLRGKILSIWDDYCFFVFFKIRSSGKKIPQSGTLGDHGDAVRRNAIRNWQ
jgi:hypothetical protein